MSLDTVNATAALRRRLRGFDPHLDDLRCAHSVSDPQRLRQHLTTATRQPVAVTFPVVTDVFFGRARLIESSGGRTALQVATEEESELDLREWQPGVRVNVSWLESEQLIGFRGRLLTGMQNGLMLDTPGSLAVVPPPGRRRYPVDALECRVHLKLPGEPELVVDVDEIGPGSLRVLLPAGPRHGVGAVLNRISLHLTSGVVSLGGRLSRCVDGPERSRDVTIQLHGGSDEDRARLARFLQESVGVRADWLPVSAGEADRREEGA